MHSRARDANPANQRCTYVSLSTAKSQFRDARNYYSPFESVSVQDFFAYFHRIVIFSSKKRVFLSENRISYQK